MTPAPLALRRVVPAAALACALAATAGCASTSLGRGELPASPLAAVYRPEEIASKRASAIKALKEREQGGGASSEGVVRLQDLDAIFGGMPEAQRRLGEVQGHAALIDPKTGDAKEIEGAPPGGRPVAWSSDRARLLLTGHWRDTTQLFAWDRATGAIEILTSGPREHPAGCFAAGERLVALELEQSGGNPSAWLAMTPPGGGGLRRLTQGPWDGQPACSPTAPLVANVTLAADGSPTIQVRDLDAPEQAHPVGRGFYPTFTPDGAWILYTAKTQQGQRLFRVRPDGSGRTAMAVSTQEESHPSVSPDGRYVAYVVTEEERERLWVRRFDGTGSRPLLGGGDAGFPVW
jgi:dipeptidyl aminopeptidase/acylaminoacyl peptidase